MENKKSYYDPLYVRKGLKDDEHISPTGRLNQTFGRIKDEQEKTKTEKHQNSEKSDTRNKPIDRGSIGKKD